MAKCKKLIIGLTGKYAAGKGEVANFLKTKSFTIYSLSDVLRKEARKLGIGETRAELIKLGKYMRKQYGPGILAEILKPQLKKNSVVDSIRHPEEIKILRKLGRFFLIGVDAPVQLRFKRAQERNRPGDPKTLKEFTKKEKSEDRKSNTSQQLTRSLEMADYLVINDSLVASLRGKIKKIFKKIASL